MIYYVIFNEDLKNKIKIAKVTSTIKRKYDVELYKSTMEMKDLEEYDLHEIFQKFQQIDKNPIIKENLTADERNQLFSDEWNLIMNSYFIDHGVSEIGALRYLELMELQFMIVPIIDEVDEISEDDLKAAADIYDRFINSLKDMETDSIEILVNDKDIEKYPNFIENLKEDFK